MRQVTVFYHLLPAFGGLLPASRHYSECRKLAKTRALRGKDTEHPLSTASLPNESAQASGPGAIRFEAFFDESEG